MSMFSESAQLYNYCEAAYLLSEKGNGAAGGVGRGLLLKRCLCKHGMMLRGGSRGEMR